MSIAPHPGKRRGIAFKLSLMILTGTAVIFTAAFGYNYIYSRNRILRDVEINVENLTLAAVSRIETVLHGVQKDPSQLAYALSRENGDQQKLLTRIDALLDNNPEIFGSAVAFEPYAFDPKSRAFAPYTFREGKSLKHLSLGDKDYPYFFQDWYQIPKELERAVWSEPYFDEGAGNIIMSTYSIPFSRKSGNTRRFTGVVTADISLDWLMDIVSRISPTSRATPF
jgi:sigma-B regulation protein RsbU (phosphoserine phosphatase)